MAQIQLDWKQIQPGLLAKGIVIKKLYEDFPTRGLGYLENKSAPPSMFLLVASPPVDTSLVITIDKPWERARKVAWTDARILLNMEAQKKRFYSMVDYFSDLFQMGTPLKYIHPCGTTVAKWAPPEELDKERREFLPGTVEI